MFDWLKALFNPDNIIQLFHQYGYWIVFFGVMIENAGVPVPGETILLVAGFFASRHGFNLWLVMLIAAVGAVLGDNAGYWLGRKAGRGFLLRYGKYVLLTEKRFTQMETFFHQHGDKTVLVARFITGFRVFTALFAGASHMNWSRFVLFNVLGAISWAVVMTLLGYFFGESWHLLEQYVKGAGWILAGAVVVALLGRFFWKRRKAASAASSNALLSEAESTAMKVEVKE
ncbi:MAG: DedA family protein [Acidobacteria bacterium]|nr:DedA family protein [Acidobacteriota bacterium]